MTAGLILVGCGKMGGALLEGWLGRGMEAAGITVVETDPAIVSSLEDKPGLVVLRSPEAIDEGPPPRVVIFAVKPQGMDQVVPAYRRFADKGTVFLSIAAGRTLGFFEQRLGDRAAIVRSIPNTPAAVGRGITVACANAPVDEARKGLCDDLLAAVGEVAWTDDEALIDAVTALSGSGPAYVFLLAECMAEAGIAAGLPGDLAHRLARATVCGAGEMLYRSQEPPRELRRNVTSPGGTTAEALDILMAGDGLQPLMTRAIAAATRRSRELAG